MIDPVAKLIELAGARPRVVVAFSGGVDSTVLAYALVGQRRKLGGLRLVHVDHGLQAASAQWSKQCAQMARGWRAPIAIVRADIQRRRGDSPEAAAREARYALLAAAMQPGEVLVTAQHRDDQAETLLLQLMRGAGVAGLAAMPAIADFRPGRIARPLLEVARAEIEAFAREARLQWIEDPSNTDVRFARNFLRHRLMPLIREQWPGAERALARTARHMAEAQILLVGDALRDLAAAADGNGLSVATLRSLPLARRRNALRVFISRAGVEMPEASRLKEITGPLLTARADAQPEVRFGAAVLRRRGGRLELQVIAEERSQSSLENVAKSWNWSADRECVLNAAQDTIALIDDAQGPIDLDRLPPVLELRARRGGERLRPGPRARTQTLKALLQAAKVPPDDRARVPLLFAG
jgi:tRNA(Ile)-lysidine synthase